jgi:hypothetical protein
MLGGVDARALLERLSDADHRSTDNQKEEHPGSQPRETSVTVQTGLGKRKAEVRLRGGCKKRKRRGKKGLCVFFLGGVGEMVSKGERRGCEFCVCVE